MYRLLRLLRHAYHAMLCIPLNVVYFVHNVSTASTASTCIPLNVVYFVHNVSTASTCIPLNVVYFVHNVSTASTLSIQVRITLCIIVQSL